MVDFERCSDPDCPMRIRGAKHAHVAEPHRTQAFDLLTTEYGRRGLTVMRIPAEDAAISVIKALLEKHDARVEELLTANGVDVERRRQVERNFETATGTIQIMMQYNNIVQRNVQALRDHCNIVIANVNAIGHERTAGFLTINELLKKCDALFRAVGP